MWRPIHKFSKVFRQHCNLTVCNSINPDEKTKKQNEYQTLFLHGLNSLSREGEESDKSSYHGRSNCSSGFFEGITNNYSRKDVLGVGSGIAAAVQIGRILDDEAKATVQAMPIKEDFLKKEETEHIYETTKSLEEIKHEIEALDKGLRGAKYYNSGKPDEAIKFWKESAYYGHSYAYFNLGLAYELGEGVEQNIDKAIYYYEKAPDHPKALYNLGAIFLQDNSTVAKAHKLISKAAEFGLAEAQSFVGVKYMLDGDETRAASLFKAAAKQENPEAQYYLGLCYQHGKGVKKNQHYAIELFKKSSRNGYQPADNELQSKGIIQMTMKNSTSSLTDYVKSHLNEFFQQDQNSGENFNAILNSGNSLLSDNSEVSKYIK